MFPLRLQWENHFGLGNKKATPGEWLFCFWELMVIKEDTVRLAGYIHRPV
jgi:hypothetical protein